MEKYGMKERLELISIYESSHSLRQTVEKFHSKYPNRRKPAISTVSSLCRRFKETGSVYTTGKGAADQRQQLVKKKLLMFFSQSPLKPVRLVAAESAISKTSVLRILHNHKFHAYKIQVHQATKETDFPPRLDICNWIAAKLNEDQNFPKHILFIIVTSVCFV